MMAASAYFLIMRLLVLTFATEGLLGIIGEVGHKKLGGIVVDGRGVDGSGEGRNTSRHNTSWFISRG